MKYDYTTNSHYLTYRFLCERFGECTFWTWVFVWAIMARYTLYVIKECRETHFTQHLKYVFASQVLCWGVRNMKRFQLTNVTSPSIEFECGGEVINSTVIKNTQKNPNFDQPLFFFDTVSKWAGDRVTTADLTCGYWNGCCTSVLNELHEKWRVRVPHIQRYALQ